MLEVKVTKTMGRGLFATQDIPANATVHVADFIKVKDVEVDKCPDIARYVFGYTKKYSALCLGLGSLFNHSDEPNVDVYFDNKDGREVMEFISLRPIKIGEQLFISYGGEDYAFAHLLKKPKKQVNLHDLVYNFKTKHKGGFTEADQQKLLKKFPKINMEKYKNAMMGHTCVMVDGELVIYHCDVLGALRCGLENRNLTEAEWD